MKIDRVKNIDRGHIVKIEKYLAFPETLDLKYIMKEPDVTVDTLYELYAVLAHRGTHYSGHYTAYVRNGDSWHFTDDAHIMSCSWGDVKTTYGAGFNSGVAYMLMYSKKGDSQC